ncbi:MAG: hypothetical protein SNF33_06450 [Candidatus Algichlamydia australiensis]|nr:hypothetical protein [Chlamydiales bacterium]
MLEAIFGKAIYEKILFYLIANEKAYPLQLKTALDLHLYSVQKALDRLEYGGILVHQKTGKTLVYQFNPRYFFLKELKQLLKKAYSAIPKEQVKKYYQPQVRKRPRRRGKPPMRDE